jgi:streptogramin lyase
VLNATVTDIAVLHKESILSAETVTVNPITRNFSTSFKSKSTIIDSFQPSLTTNNPVFALSPDQLFVTIKEWALPTAGSAPTSLALDPSTNNVYFTELRAEKIGRLNPSTNVVTEWTLLTTPSGPLGPYNIAINPNSPDNVYFTEEGADKIGRLNPSTNVITKWTLPTANNSPLDLEVDPSSNNVYFTEYRGNKIGRLNPSTHSITEWTLPTGFDSPRYISIHPSTRTLYFTFGASGINQIGRLNPLPMLLLNGVRLQQVVLLMV